VTQLLPEFSSSSFFNSNNKIHYIPHAGILSMLTQYLTDIKVVFLLTQSSLLRRKAHIWHIGCSAVMSPESQCGMVE
jgi:peptidase E